MAAFQPLPVPGVAVFPQYLSNTPTQLIMLGKRFSADFTITHADGRPFLTVDAHEFSSLSGRKHLIDAVTGKRLCDLRAKHFSRHDRYYGEVVEGNPPLFETESHKVSLFGGKYETTMRFANAAAGGKPEELYLQSHSFKTVRSTVTWRNMPVAYIEEQKGHFVRDEYHISIAPGMDPFLVAALAIALDDKESEDQSSHASSAAAGAAGGGGA